VLDCTTEVGRQYLAHEDETARRVGFKLRCQPVKLGGLATTVDRAFIRDGHIVGLAEIKTRGMSVQELRGFGSYLVTAKKLQDGMDLARALGVPYVLIVRTLKDDAVVCWTISDKTGRQLVKWETNNTVTQAGCNGGTAYRANAYIPLTHMRLL
jgi:hypothetical protein